MFVMGSVLGSVLLFIFIFMQINKKKFNYLLDAKLIKFNQYGYGLSAQYSPVFQYTYNGKTYENQSSQTLSQKQCKKYIIGNQYKVYINETNPNRVIISKRFSFIDLLFLIFSICFIISSLLLIGY